MKFPKSKRLRTIMKYFKRITIPSFLILFISIYSVYTLQIKNQKELIKIKQQRDVCLLKYDLEHALNSIASDLKIIKNSNEVTNYLHNPNSENLDNMKKMFARYTENKKIYRTIKFIDLNNQLVVDFENKQNLDLNKTFMEFKMDLEDKNKKKIGELIVEYESEYLWKKVLGYVQNHQDFSFVIMNHNQKILTQGDYNNIVINEKLGSIEKEKGIYYVDTASSFKASEEKIFLYGKDAGSGWKIISYYPNHKFNSIKKIWFKDILHIIIIFIVIISVLSYMSAVIIYKRKKAVKRLKLLMNILENLGEAVIFTDANTNIIYVNKTFSEITGYSQEEVIGLKTSYFKSGKHSKSFYSNMWNSIETTGRWQGEIWDKRKGEKSYPKYLTIMAVKEEQGRVTGYIGIFRDLSEIKNKEKSINKLKNYDITTSLPNASLMKKIFNNKLSKLEELDDKNIYVVSLIIINYDTVKNSLGMSSIDNLALEFSRRIKGICKEEGMFSRMSSDEFLILIKEKKDQKLILDFSKKIINSLKEPFIFEDNSVYLKVDIGISAYPKDSEDINKLVEKANIARANAKELGEYNVVIYEKKLRDEYLQEVNIENLLRRAIERGEIYLNYQPQVQLKSGKIVGAEALIRWNSKEIGMVYPNKFIPIAENTDMIIPIGKWVLEEACKNLSLWREKYNKDITIAVNISPVQFKKSDMYKTIKETLQKYTLPGHCLEIEITEGVLIDNIYDIQKQLKSIRDLGVKIAMDDFGTGYSSLSYLRKFNFDKVKIDREFVQDYPEKEDGTLAEIIINLSHSLKLKVIAEGVETEEQLKFMSQNSCDEVQGYFYSPPVSKEEFERMIEKGIFIN